MVSEEINTMSERNGINLERASKKVAYLLRHKKGFCGEDGWAKVTEVVKEIKNYYPGFNKDMLEEIVYSDKKGRYIFDKHKIRIKARYGHSVSVNLELEPTQPPEILYHGTAERFLSSIMREGLNSQTRNYVHLSTSVEMAETVGKRHGKVAMLKIYTGKMYQDGYEFFCAEKASEDNGGSDQGSDVWLTQSVPTKYIERIYKF